MKTMDPLAHRVAARHAGIIPKVDTASVLTLINRGLELIKSFKDWLASTKKAVKEASEGQPDGFLLPRLLHDWQEQHEKLAKSAEELSEDASNHPNWHDAGVVSDAVSRIEDTFKALWQQRIKDVDPGQLYNFSGSKTLSTGTRDVLYSNTNVDNFVQSFSRWLSSEETLLKKAVSQVKSFEARQKKHPSYRA